ncbi:MAG: HAD family hydrolase [Pseudomonadales bacterium]|jgi:HAD superfamily hydrolase (TIGR01490 family)|nr:HAD family hydrolase [Pseudomonadales bacterium]
MPLAIFDLDETLIATDSDHEWGEYVCDHGLVNEEVHRARNDAFYEQYKAGELDIYEYLAFSCSVLTRYSMDKLQAYRSDFVEKRIAPKMLEKGRALIDEHKNRGDQVMVITSTIEFVTRPIVDAFGIEILIAPDPEIIDNRYTGNIVGVPSFGEGKVTRLKSWMSENNETLNGSYFYSDSHNDLPLLRLVDNPIAVDPDLTLRAEAEKKQWQIISLRN